MAGDLLVVDKSELAEAQKLALFDNVPEDIAIDFLATHKPRNYKADQTIFTAYDGHESLYLLLRGVVKTYVVSSQGMEQITHLFYPGEAFGGLFFGVDQDPAPWATALDEVRLIALNRVGFRRMMVTFPDVCMNVFRYLVEHHNQDMRRLQTLIHTKAGDRLVMTLLHLSARQGDEDCETFTIRPRLTHETLANMIGVVRSTLSELMTSLRRRGILISRGREITVDRRAAEKFLRDSASGE